MNGEGMLFQSSQIISVNVTTKGVEKIMKTSSDFCVDSDAFAFVVRICNARSNCAILRKKHKLQPSIISIWIADSSFKALKWTQLSLGTSAIIPNIIVKLNIVLACLPALMDLDVPHENSITVDMASNWIWKKAGIKSKNEKLNYF